MNRPIAALRRIRVSQADPRESARRGKDWARPGATAAVPSRIRGAGTLVSRGVGLDGPPATKPLDQLLTLVYALLGLAILIALLGIANTLAPSIVEGTRELGLLRAVGMTRSQLRSSIRWESVIIAVQGTVLGLLISVFVGWALVSALSDEGITVFRIPYATLAAVVVLAAVAGMAAAVPPSRRAAELDVLRAVVSE